MAVEEKGEILEAHIWLNNVIGCASVYKMVTSFTLITRGNSHWFGLILIKIYRTWQGIIQFGEVNL